MEENINIAGRLHSTATGNVVAGANEIYDDAKGKKQSVVNAENDIQLASHESRLNAYTEGKFVTVSNYSALPDTGAVDTVYRVSSWDGTANNGQGAVDVTKYSEYAWQNEAYKFLDVKTQIGEVFDISEYNSGAVYTDLANALGTSGVNVPSSIRRGGMSVKFKQLVSPASYTVEKTEGLDSQPTGTEISTDPHIDSGTYNESQLSAFSTLPESTGAGNAVTYWMEVAGDTTTYTSWVITMVQSSDNKYVQFRLMAQNFTTDVTQWQGVDSELTPNENLVNGVGIYDAITENVLKETHTKIASYDLDDLTTGAYSFNGIGESITYTSSRIGANYKSAKIECVEGNIVRIKTEGGAASFRGLQFIDEDNKSLWASDSGIIDGYFTAPANTANIVVDFKSDSVIAFVLDFYKKDTTEIEKEIDEIEESLTDEQSEITKIDNVLEIYSTYNVNNLSDGACSCYEVGSAISVNAQVSGNKYGKFPCKAGSLVEVTTESGYISGAFRGLAFVNSDNEVLWCSPTGIVDLSKTAPANTAYVVINYETSSSKIFKLITESVDNRIDKVESDIAEIKGLIYKETDYTVDDLTTGAYACNVVGQEVTYTQTGLGLDYKSTKIECSPNKIVSIKTEGGSLTGGYRGLAFLDASNVVLWCSDGAQINLTQVAPVNTAYVIFQHKNASSVTFEATIKDTINNVLSDLEEKVDAISEPTFSLPQIAMNVSLKKNLNEPIRIMCFGSSWLMNTWWYLPYILNNVGINANLKCFLSDGAYFQQWVQRYEGVSESEIGSNSARIYTSTNGGDWSYVNYTVGDFKDALEEGWDLIVYQQGAYASIRWELRWEPYMNTLLSYVRRSVGSNTIIAFNSTWTPGENGSLNGKTKEEWQTINYENCQKMCNICGLNNYVIPNGAAIWALRNDEVLTDDNDFSSDGLHLKSGNPVLLTGLNLYETLIAPIYGISVDNVTWYPDTDTPKCPASGSSWSEVTASGLERLKKMCKMSASKRFGFETL